MDGVIEYVLNGRVQGWVRWPAGNEERTFSLVTSGTEHPLLVHLTDRVGQEDIQTFRFHMSGLNIESIASGERSVVARCGAITKRLSLWRVLRLANEVSALNDSQRKSLQVWQGLIKDATISFPDSSLDACTESEERHGYGCISEDGDAMVGRNGFLFLGEGTNRVSDLYVNEYAGKSDLWLDLFVARHNSLGKRGIDYLQVVIPEKSSALSEYCPFRSARPSPVLARLVESVRANDMLQLATIFPFLDGNAETQFLRTDSHLSSDGARSVVEGMLKTKNLGLGSISEVEKTILLKGDLGLKYPGDWREIVKVSDEITFSGRTMKTKLVRSKDPHGGGHKGIERVWVNEAAPFPIKVVAFANSFFERGAVSTQISWWCARLFSEFHFIWSPTLDNEYVDSVGPDLVVCQTIERFLRVVPKS